METPAAKRGATAVTAASSGRCRATEKQTRHGQAASFPCSASCCSWAADGSFWQAECRRRVLWSSIQAATAARACALVAKCCSDRSSNSRVECHDSMTALSRADPGRPPPGRSKRYTASQPSSPSRLAGRCGPSASSRHNSFQARIPSRSLRCGRTRSARAASMAREAGYRPGSERGSPNHGSTLASKRVMPQIWPPARVST